LRMLENTRSLLGTTLESPMRQSASILTVKKLPFPRAELNPRSQNVQLSAKARKSQTKSFSNAGWWANLDQTSLGTITKSKLWRRTGINTPWNWTPSCTIYVGWKSQTWTHETWEPTRLWRVTLRGKATPQSI